MIWNTVLFLHLHKSFPNYKGKTYTIPCIPQVNSFKSFFFCHGNCILLPSINNSSHLKNTHFAHQLLLFSWWNFLKKSNLWLWLKLHPLIQWLLGVACWAVLGAGDAEDLESLPCGGDHHVSNCKLWQVL